MGAGEYQQNQPVMLRRDGKLEHKKPTGQKRTSDVMFTCATTRKFNVLSV